MPVRTAATRPSVTLRHVTGMLVAALALAGCTSGADGGASSASVPASSPGATVPGAASSSSPAPATPAALPRPARTVVVVMENHSLDDVLDDPDAPWLNHLPAAVLTDWHGVTHPSQPNYVALLTGSTHGVTSDHCPTTVTGGSLPAQLTAAGLTFTGFSEGLPAAGSTTCSAGRYRRKHNPWVDVRGLPATMNQPFSAFPADPAALPTVSVVVPDMCHDTHDCRTARGDAWLRENLGPYVAWAQDHDGLLVLTYDESEHHSGNHIPTLLVGPMVRPGRYTVRGDHYTTLRTLEAMYGLPAIGEAAAREPLTGIWR